MSENEDLHRWVTYDFVCWTCGEKFDNLCRVRVGDPPPEWARCICGEPGKRVPAFGSTMNVALPDGNRRLDPVRKHRAIQKAERKARKEGNKEELKRVQKEREAIKGRT